MTRQLLNILAKENRGDLAFGVLKVLLEQNREVLDLQNWNTGIAACARSHLWEHACLLLEETGICFDSRFGLIEGRLMGNHVVGWKLLVDFHLNQASDLKSFRTSRL